MVEVVTVDSAGKIRGVAVGTAQITVSTENGKTASCRVSVKNAPDGLDHRNVTVRVNVLKKLIENSLSNLNK